MEECWLSSGVARTRLQASSRQSLARLLAIAGALWLLASSAAAAARGLGPAPRAQRTGLYP